MSTIYHFVIYLSTMFVIYFTMFCDKRRIPSVYKREPCVPLFTDGNIKTAPAPFTFLRTDAVFQLSFLPRSRRKQYQDREKLQPSGQHIKDQYQL